MKETMNSSSQAHPVGQLLAQDSTCEAASFVPYGDLEDTDSKDMTAERKQAVFMRAFAGNLKAEGLRSPQYYRDKSQCLSFHENASPAEMGYLKARTLKHGYIEPEELISRLRELKPSENFTLRKYRHPWMKWDKSPIVEKSDLIQPPESEWLLHQRGKIVATRRQIGTRVSERYRLEAQEHWDKVMKVERTPLPDLHLLKQIGRSPSGTLFPRYLVKGLYELREAANDRGVNYYDEEYDKAEIKRRDLIQRWQKENPDSVLAKDPISIYRTWPSDLMNQLDLADKEGIQRGCARYMADLRETEKKMQLLVTFWRDCDLITGQRTPPSPPWPDPKARIRGLDQPQYVRDRLEALSAEYERTQDRERYEKLQFIEVTRWKEAALNAGSEPSASDTPFPPSLMDELDVAWQGYDNFEPEETEDAMITRIAQWRKSKDSKFYPDYPQAPSPNESTDRTTGKTRNPVSTGASFGLDDIASKKTPEKHLPSCELEQDIELTVQKSIWWGRLRPRKEASKATNTPMEKPRGIDERGVKGPTRRTQPRATKDAIDRPKGLKLVSKTAGPPKTVEGIGSKVPVGSKPGRSSERLQRLADLSSTAQPRGVQKTRGSRRNRSKDNGQGCSSRNRDLLHLTPPQSK